MKTLAFLCLAIGVTLTVGCNRESGQAAGETDSAMQQRIASRINADAELNSAHLSVDADAAQNKATISGTVDSEELQTRALDLARNADPGVIIDNRIDVVHHEMTRAEYSEELAQQEREKAKAGLEKIGNTLDDAWIHSKVVGKLVLDPLVTERHINVDVENNVVTLRGTVDSAMEKAEAEEIAKQTDGVKAVIDHLKIQRIFAGHL